MTCEEVLATLSTASLRDMTADSAVMAHCDTCLDCARVTTMVREKEYEAATVLNGLLPMSSPITLAEQSVVASKRRRLGRVAVAISGAALAVTIWVVGAMMVIPAMNRADDRFATTLRTETIRLSCLTPKQAADVINPYVRSHGSTYYLPSSDISAITIRGTPAELAKSRDLIFEFESDPNAACRTTMGVFTHPAPDKVPTAPKSK